MSKSWAWLLLCLSSFTCAQSIVIPAKQCVVRAGDDPAWAKPDLDESGWMPYAQYDFTFDQPRLWMRCKADLGAIRGLSEPAIQVSAPAAYEVYLDGRLVGRLGSLQRGDFSMDRTRTWALPREAETGSGIVAVRLAYRKLFGQGLAIVRLGSRTELKAIRDSIVLGAIRADAGMFVCYTVIGVIGLGLLGLYLSDRSRMEVLLLALSGLLIALLRFCIFAVDAQVGISVLVGNLIFNVGASILTPVEVYFFFRVARRRMHGFILILVAIAVLWTTLSAATSLVPYALAVRMQAALSERYLYICMVSLVAAIEVASVLIAFLPFAAFRRAPACWQCFAGCGRSPILCGSVWKSPLRFPAYPISSTAGTRNWRRPAWQLCCVSWWR